MSPKKIPVFKMKIKSRGLGQIPPTRLKFPLRPLDANKK